MVKVLVTELLHGESMPDFKKAVSKVILVRWASRRWMI